MTYIQRIAFILMVTLSSMGSLLQAETVTYYITDLTGSPIAAMDEAGGLKWRESTNPYGETRINPTANKDDVGFTGHQQDDATNLVYMQARYYDPVIGRFYGFDPIGYTAKNPVMSFNRYLYVNNNPYKYTDPNGEFILGAVINVSSTFIANGGSISVEQFTGASVGGFATGAMVASGVPLSLANAVGGALGNAAEQYAGVATGKQDSISGGQVFTSGLISAAVGNLPIAKAPSVTSGTGNMRSVFQGQITKMANGITSRMSSTTVGKGVCDALATKC